MKGSQDICVIKVEDSANYVISSMNSDTGKIIHADRHTITQQFCELILRVRDQIGISRLYTMLEIYHSGQEPWIY